MLYKGLNEETLKNSVARDYFKDFDCTETLKNIDFTVKPKHGLSLDEKYFLWAEAKAACNDIFEMLTQLILTIGKSKVFNLFIPPPYIGCFDSNKIAFLEYSEIMDIFYLNDFNWNVTPSNSDTDEFRLVYDKLKQLFAPPSPSLVIDNEKWIMDNYPLSIIHYPLFRGGKLYIYDFEKDENEIKSFIKNNFIIGNPNTSVIQINKNNFKWIYDKWIAEVKPSIELIFSWDDFRNQGIIDADFYLADLMSIENKTIGDKLFVLLDEKKYVLEREIKLDGKQTHSIVNFNDGQKAHKNFWSKYERPPREEFRDYILERRDLLVSQDIRERKGSFYTPQIWVEKSQEYLADVFGDDWQQNYYVWDCAAGTGNMLVGLTEKYRNYASTLDRADVAVLHERIDNGANLLKDHCFQFDFLNDDFNKLPDRLQAIIKNEPEKLIIYINPPYAEATSISTRLGTRKHKSGVAVGNKTHIKYSTKMGKARNELFTQFLTRIYYEIPGCKIGEFSKQKALVSPNFKDFRKFFFVDFKKGFIAPANSFDNVKGKFPIGFKIWDTKGGKHFESAIFDVYNADGSFQGNKEFIDGPECLYINDWMKRFRDETKTSIGKICYVGNDFQSQNSVFIDSIEKEVVSHYVVHKITQNNLLKASIYFTVRKVIPATWINDRDQFLFPNDDWKKDIHFQTDCLTYTLFHNSNNIKSKHGTNHWIPFTAEEVNARTGFDSSFMTDFFNGKVKPLSNGTLVFDDIDTDTQSIPFSDRAKDVFYAGREIWRYYHTQVSSTFQLKKSLELESSRYNVNASFYDIREYFQGRDDKGRMKSTSKDERYNHLMNDLRLEIKYLAKQIEKKVYEYGFLLNEK